MAWAQEGSSGGSGSASSGTGSGSAGASMSATPAAVVPQAVIQVNTPAATLPGSTPATEGRADAAAPSRGNEAKTQDAHEKDAKKQDASEKDTKKQDEPDKQEQVAEKDESVFKSEFQNFVAQSVGRTLPMYGYSLFHRAPSTFAPVDNIPVTPDYTIGPGDELIVHVWGQVEASQSVVVDRNGLINLPKIGSISVAGVRYQKLTDHIRDAIGRMFSNFELDVSMGKLRSIQVFVVGQAARPGNYTVSSLSTLVNTLFVSGGPSAKGSMRHIQLKRGNKLISDFDLYDLLLKGDKSRDVKLLPGDVIYIPPIGAMAAISGSVNTQAIFELKGKENLSDLLDLAGGLTNVAAGQKVSVERIQDHEMRKVDEFQLDKDGLAKPLRDGDVVTVFSISPRFDNAVKLQGNVAAPMRYIWKEGMRITDLLNDKNSVIPGAYWARQNSGALNNRYNKKEVNWDYAVVQHLDVEKLATKLIAFNLGKAIEGDSSENRLLQPGDVVTIYSADEVLPKTENDVVFRGSIFSPSDRRFVWREGMRINDLIPSGEWLTDYYEYWSNLRGNKLSSGTYNKKEINWDYAVVQRLDEEKLVTRLVAFNLGKAIKGDPEESMPLQPGDIVTVFSADEALPKTENDIVLKGSIFSPSNRRFVWREGMRISDLIPSAKWLTDYYDYWLNSQGSKLSSGIHWEYANIVRLQPRDLRRTMIPFDLGKVVLENDSINNLALFPGDVVTIYTNEEIQAPVANRSQYVRLEGEFRHAGVYKAEAGETLRQLVARVGGVSPQAYLFGSEFTRETTRQMQQKRLEEITDSMEVEVQRNVARTASGALSKEDLDAAKAQTQSQMALINKMRQVKATGRIVMEMPEQNTQLKDLPDIALEDGDRIFVPTPVSTVSVMGTVYNQSAFLYKPGQSVNDYLNKAGGPTRDGDEDDVYLIRADGLVFSKRQGNSMFGGFDGRKVMPGDVIVVPEKLEKFNLTKNLKDWTQIFFQFALGAAGGKTAKLW